MSKSRKVETPAEWEGNENKIEQKDTDARWTKKNGVSYYGYKNHVKCEQKNKFITGYTVTNASVHDSQEIVGLLVQEDEGQPVYADSGYIGEELNMQMVEKKVKPIICEKGFRNHPITDEQKASNKEKSKVRVRVEHIFGFIENSMNGSTIKTIGIKRAKAMIGLMNLTYNLFRKVQITNPIA